MARCRARRLEQEVVVKVKCDRCMIGRAKSCGVLQSWRLSNSSGT